MNTIHRNQESTIPEAPRSEPARPVQSRKDIEALYRAERKSLLTLAVRITRNADEAEDVVEAAFLHALEASHKRPGMSKDQLRHVLGDRPHCQADNNAHQLLG